MKRIIMSLMALAICLLSLGAAGCDSSPRVYLSDDNQILPAPPMGRLAGQRPSPIPDVAIPEGFVVVQKKSRSQLANNVRFVEHYYQGRASKADTVDFYRRALPVDGWREEAYQFDGANYVLRHGKNREVLDLRVTESRDVTSVWIQVRDRALPAPPPSAAPGASPPSAGGAAAPAASASVPGAKPLPTSANPAPPRPAAP